MSNNEIQVRNFGGEVPFLELTHRRMRWLIDLATHSGAAWVPAPKWLHWGDLRALYMYGAIADYSTTRDDTTFARLPTSYTIKFCREQFDTWMLAQLARMPTSGLKKRTRRPKVQ